MARDENPSAARGENGAEASGLPADGPSRAEKSASEVGASFGVVPGAVVVVAHDGSILYANPHAEELFGYEKGALAGTPVEALIPERLRRKHTRLRERCVADPDVLPMGKGRELPAVRADGTEFPVEVALAPTGHEARHVVVLVRDLTDVVKVRENLRRSEQRFRVAAESTADLIWEADEPNDSLTYFGDIDRLLGFEPGEFPRTLSGWLAEIHPDDRETVKEVIAKIIATGEYFDFDYRIRSKDGTYRRWEDRGVVTELINGRASRAVGAVTDVTERVLAEQELKDALTELAQLKDRLQREIGYLQDEIKSKHNFDEIIGSSGTLIETLHAVDQVAGTDYSVLLLGETGTGKELLARAIHSRSRRKDRPLIKVDCSTLPAGLIESELFGHEKGAFTGAVRKRIGRFELADGGTILLDEIGELPLDLQTKLLRVLEERRFERLGSGRTLQVDVRVIASTNRDLAKSVEAGEFRSDLFYRLNVFPIRVPPLRERLEDIPLLVEHFIAKHQAELGRKITRVTSLEALMAYEWPGNVRELAHVVERALILSPGPTLRLDEPLGGAKGRRSSPRSMRSLEEAERVYITEVLKQCGWRVKGVGNAAELLGLNPSTLRSRIKKLGIRRPEDERRPAAASPRRPSASPRRASAARGIRVSAQKDR